MRQDKIRSHAVRIAVWTVGMSMALAGFALSLSGSAFAATSAAAKATAGPPVLLVDAGLGDSTLELSSWLGGKARAVAVEPGGTLTVWAGGSPRWWQGATAPRFYVLASTDQTGAPVPGGIAASDIAWGIDTALADARADKVVLVAQGAAGLQARAYLEDLSTPAQSLRADTVGLIELGTPNRGLGLMDAYPKVGVWDPFASGASLKREDISPGSSWLARLDGAARSFPAVCRIALIEGDAATMGGVECDGATALGESALPTVGISAEIQRVRIVAKVSDAFPFTRAWQPATNAGGEPLNPVDPAQIEKLGLGKSYLTQQQSVEAIERLYTSWFSGGIPATHMSTRLVVDVSGSMNESWSGKTKMDASRRAAQDFVDALLSRTRLPASIPEDLGLVIFSDGAALVVPPTAAPSRIGAQIRTLKGGGNTDIGEALTMSLQSLSSSPKAADKMVLLLSDGASNTGISDAQIMAGPVAKAKRDGVRVNTIGLGSIDANGIKLLKEIAAATGGTFTKPGDSFALRNAFIRSRFASLGVLSADAEAKVSAPATIKLGAIPQGANRLEVAIVPDQGSVTWTLTRDGAAVPKSAYSAQSGSQGLIFISLRKPAPGSYALRLVGKKGVRRAHVYAVSNVDLFRQTGATTPPDTSAMLLLVALGVICVVAVGVASFLSLRKRSPELPEEFGQPSSADEPGLRGPADGDPE